MKVYTDLKDFNKPEFAVVTTGTFDGVHTGHRKILKRVNDIAKENNGESVLLTFFPHPRMVLFPDDNSLKLLNTQSEKIRLLEETGLDHLIIFPFTKDFSRTTALEYVRDLLVNQIGVKKLVIGYDHQFGRNREGSLENLIELGPLYGFEVEEIPAFDIDDVKVSSTKIRKAIGEGDIKTANTYLSSNYLLSGIVTQGNKVGRSIGFPTANIQVVDTYKLIPADGAYAVDVEVNGGKYRGMLNIGMRPTIMENEKQQTIEVNIFDFAEDIYGEVIVVEFLDKIRSEMKFDTIEDLKEQLKLDKIRALNV